MKTRLIISRLILASILSTTSTMINSAPSENGAGTSSFMIEGFDKLFEQSSQTTNGVSIQAEDDPGKAFVRELSSITEQELQAAGNNQSATATELASNFPEQSRDNMQRIFNIALYVQKRIEKAAKVPEGDIATATASFLYGIWSAYNEGAEIPEENLLELHKQVGELISANEALSKGIQNANLSQRQKLYEYLSMTGNWMVMFQDTFSKKPDQNTINNIKGLAKELLQASFKIDVEKLHISQEGKLSLL
ncbi:MAG: DUF6683 family protein [Candidatus Thiodiazotropha sp. 6PLUC2]